MDVLLTCCIACLRLHPAAHDERIQALEESGLPKKLRMVVMCNKPSFEFRAFQVTDKTAHKLAYLCSHHSCA